MTLRHPRARISTAVSSFQCAGPLRCGAATHSHSGWALGVQWVAGLVSSRCGFGWQCRMPRGHECFRPGSSMGHAGNPRSRVCNTPLIDQRPRKDALRWAPLLPRAPTVSGCSRLRGRDAHDLVAPRNRADTLLAGHPPTRVSRSSGKKTKAKARPTPLPIVRSVRQGHIRQFVTRDIACGNRTSVRHSETPVT